MIGHHTCIKLEEVKMCHRGVGQIGAEAANIDLTGAVQVEVAGELVVEGVSDHDPTPIFQLQLQILDRHL